MEHGASVQDPLVVHGAVPTNQAHDDSLSRSFRDRLRKAFPHLLLLVPLLAAIVFVNRYSIALAVTDEWFFVNGSMSLEAVDLSSSHGISDALDAIPTRWGEHRVIVPFLIYYPISELTHFDSRWFMYFTVALYALQAVLFRRYLVTSSLWLLPIVLLLFSLSHYMEILWGWQFTLSLSIAFTVVGLVILDRIPVESGWRRQSLNVLGCILCSLLATLSSAGGYFGFPCAFLLVALKPLEGRQKAGWLAFLALIGAVAYVALMQYPRHIVLNPTQIPQILTILGGTIWGTPVGLFEYGLDFRSITGFVIVASLCALVFRAARIGALGRLSLALSIAAFGLLCAMSIVLARTYVGNWHLEFALPAVCGAYAAGYLLWNLDRTWHTAVPFFALLALLVAGVSSCYRGFAEYGPTYNEYIRSVETYAKTHLEHPGHPKPFSEQLDTTPEMLLFLSAHEHPMFADSPPPGTLRRLPETARVFLDREEAAQPLSLTNVGKPRMLTVAVPIEAAARGVLAEFGTSRLVLRRINARNNHLVCCKDPEFVCFAGLIISVPSKRGPQPVQLSLFD